MQIDDVVQFNENHKWCGSLGIIAEIKPVGDDIRYMIGVPIPMQGTAYIFTMASENAMEFIGRAVMVASPQEYGTDRGKWQWEVRGDDR